MVSASRQNHPSFLIHYGWRGTCGLLLAVVCQLLFLIHYGWRGTEQTAATLAEVRGF